MRADAAECPQAVEVRDVIDELPPPQVYEPFMDGPFRLQLGLKPLDPAAWFELDRTYDEQMRERTRLLAERRGEVLMALPGSEHACRETLTAVMSHLAAIYPRWFVEEGPQFINRLLNTAWSRFPQGSENCLSTAAHLVPEDLCVLEASAAGYRLTAACVAFPSRWRLGEKIGRTVMDVHAPVAFYDTQLGAPVDRLLATLAPGRVLWRLNWNLHEAPELFQPTGMGRSDVDRSITAENAARRLWLRVERQTVRRLPASGAILFTIRTYVDSLQGMAARPAVAARLAAAIRALPEDTFRYKSLPVFAAALLEWLDRAAAGDMRQAGNSGA